MTRRLLRRCLLAVRYLGAAALLSLVPLGAAGIVDEALLPSAIDAAHRCRGGDTEDCLTEQRGIVHKGNAWWDIRVGYDDDQRRMGLLLEESDEPPAGTRVRIQRWNDEVVAVFDPATETRYRTLDWPERDIPEAVFGLLLVALVGWIGYLLGPQLIRWPVRRLRRLAASARRRGRQPRAQDPPAS